MAKKKLYITTSEAEEQTCLFQWAELQTFVYPELALMYHIPNEGKRTKFTGARLKAQGLKSGVPDVHLPVPRGQYHGLFIEMKSAGGKISDNQTEWLKKLQEQGYKTMVCVGWVAASEEIIKYLKTKG